MREYPLSYPSKLYPAQTILNKITSTSIDYPQAFPADISSSTAQKYLLAILHKINNNVLTATDLADSTITLQSGSNNLADGNNPAVLTLNFYGYKATRNITIAYRTL